GGGGRWGGGGARRRFVGRGVGGLPRDGTPRDHSAHRFPGGPDCHEAHGRPPQGRTPSPRAGAAARASGERQNKRRLISRSGNRFYVAGGQADHGARTAILRFSLVRTTWTPPAERGLPGPGR